MDAVSLFAGIGGFDRALERAGVTVTKQVEIEPHAQAVLRRHFPDTELIEDVRNVGKVTESIVVGGFPCQDISTAGRRAGLAGERSGLWFEFARILDESRPEWCVIENVAGLLSSNRGADLGTILGTLADLGYGFAYRVLDAQFFGVPQRRRRVFIVGHLGDWRRAAAVLLEPEGGCWNPPTRRETGADLAGALTQRIDRGGVNSEGGDNHLIADTLRPHVRPGSNTVDQLAVVPQTFDWQVAGSERTWIHDHPGGPARSLTAHKTLAVHTVGLGSDVLHAEELAQPITGRHGDPGVIGAPHIGVRKLMPVECERLQGFPDGWTEGHADTHRYRMLGNAVAVPVVEWIARRLVAQA